MRRVRNHNKRSNNPAVLFASGFESLVSDQLRNPSRYDEEQNAGIEPVTKKKTGKENFISFFCQLIFWGKPA